MRIWVLAPVVVALVSACTSNEDVTGGASGGYLADSGKYVAAADWSKAVELAVDLSEFKFRPNSLTLRAGQAYALKLTNVGLVGHNFTAGEFFRAIAVKSILYVDGEGIEPRIEVISLNADEMKTLFFVAVTPGTYPLICDRPLHKKLGMVGSILIE